MEIKESIIESKHLIVKCFLNIKDKIIQTHTIIGCGATGIIFVNQDFVCYYQLKENELKETRQLELINGRPIEPGMITIFAELELGIKEYQEKLLAFITKLGPYPIVLELP